MPYGTICWKVLGWSGDVLGVRFPDGSSEGGPRLAVVAPAAIALTQCGHLHARVVLRW